MRKYLSSKQYQDDLFLFQNSKIKHVSQNQLDKSEFVHEALQFAKISVKEAILDLPEFQQKPQTFQLTQIKKSQISPLIQVKLKNKLIREKTASEHLNMPSPPKTSKLLCRAKKVQDQTLKYLFIKDWEKAQWDFMVKQQKLKSINEFQANPQFDIAKNNYPQYNLEDMTLDCSKNITMDYERDDKEKLSIKGNTVKTKSEAKEQSKRFFSIDDQDQIFLQKLPNTLDIYQKIDCSIRGMIMNQELGCVKDKQAKYLSRNDRVENPLSVEQNYQKHLDDVQKRAKTTVVKQVQNKAVNCSLDLVRQRQQSTKENLYLNPFQKEYELLSNPYVIKRKTFTLQKLQRSQWSNFHSVSQIEK